MVFIDSLFVDSPYAYHGLLVNMSAEQTALEAQPLPPFEVYPMAHIVDIQCPARANDNDCENGDEWMS